MELAQVRALVADNPRQVQRLATLDPLLEERRHIIDVTGGERHPALVSGAGTA